MNFELENRLEGIRHEAEILFREQLRLRAAAASRLAELRCLIAENVEAQCAVSDEKTKTKTLLANLKATGKNNPQAGHQRQS